MNGRLTDHSQLPTPHQLLPGGYSHLPEPNLHQEVDGPRVPSLAGLAHLSKTSASPTCRLVCGVYAAVSALPWYVLVCCNNCEVWVASKQALVRRLITASMIPTRRNSPHMIIIICISEYRILYMPAAGHSCLGKL